MFDALDRWLARCWLAHPQLARRLLDACALYLRHAPCATGQRSLLAFCTRSLLPALPLSFGISLLIYFATTDGGARREAVDGWAGPEVRPWPRPWPRP